MPSSLCPLNLDRSLHELCPHGTADFPCAAYDETYSAKTVCEFPWHWHDEIEVIHVTKGRMEVHVPGKKVFVSAGGSVFINSGILHYGKSPLCTIHSLVFSPLLVSGAAGSAIDTKYMQPLIHYAPLDIFVFGQGSADEEITSCIELSCSALANDAPGAEFAVRENISKICFAVYKTYKDEIVLQKSGPDTDSVRVQKMMSYIHEHFSQHLTLAQIASAADIGERESLRCFNRSIQITPVQYLIDYRLRESASMLVKNSTETISQIALDCGFASPANFTQLFRRMYKCTPREYRAMHT